MEGRRLGKRCFGVGGRRKRGEKGGGGGGGGEEVKNFLINEIGRKSN